MIETLMIYLYLIFLNKSLWNLVKKYFFMLFCNIISMIL